MGLKSDFAWMLASRSGTLAAGLLTGALINRSLGPGGRGVYAEMQTWVALFIVIFGLSLDSGINHYANRERYGSDDSRRFATTSLLATLYGIIGAGALAALVYLRPGEVSTKTAELIAPPTLLLFCSMLASNTTVLLQALNEVKTSAIIGMVQTVVSVAVIGGGYALGVIRIEFLVGYLVVIQAVSLVIMGAFFRMRGIMPGRFSREMAWGMTKVGAKLHVAAIAAFIYTKVNQLIVFRYSGESEAGIYAVALNLAFYAAFIPTTLQTALYPRVIHFQDEFEVTVRSLRLAFYGWGILVMVIILLARPILLIYGGSQFLPSVNVFRVLMLSAWLLPLSSLVAPYCIKVGAFGLLTLSAVLLGLISLVANFLLIPSYLSMGAAYATALVCAIGFCMAILLLWYKSGRNPLGFLKIQGIS